MFLVPICVPYDTCFPGDLSSSACGPSPTVLSKAIVDAGPRARLPGATSEVAQGEGGEVQAWAVKRGAQVGGAGLANTVLVVLLPLL